MSENTNLIHYQKSRDLILNKKKKITMKVTKRD